MYTERLLHRGLKTRVFGKRIYTFESIDSTNNCAKAVAGCGAQEGTVVFAEQQTAGRGRLGRPWQANPFENLTFSIVLRPKLNAEGFNLLPLYTAVAVAEAVEKTTKLPVECKWPNDLLIGKKKFAGILIEGSIKDNAIEYVVIGVGINVNQMQFAGELEAKATSLRVACNKEIDRSALLRDVLQNLERHYKQMSSGGFQSILSAWLSRSSMINKPISISQQGNIISGIVKGITTEGGLILQTGGLEKTVFAGDVTVVGM
jgi:BirA family transcriptional regulator, biotin operon repressor / biotin---[acetyl-CoA-carboxylase] ligase